MLSFTLLGQTALLLDGSPLNQLQNQKGVALLIYLAHTNKPQQREFLAELLWESSSIKQSLTNLRTILSRLRKQIGDKLLVTRKSVELPAANTERVDSRFLLQTIVECNPVNTAQKAAVLQDALTLYQGAFLESFNLPNAPQFNEWVMTTRESIRRQVIIACARLGKYALTLPDANYGIGVARRWLEIDPLDEDAHYLLIERLIAAGNRREASIHYNHCVKLLQTELGVKPPAKMTVLIQRLQPRRAASFRPTTAVRHNLPAPYNQFFGRQRSSQEIQVRLDQPWCRLVTIVGQGGIGKTRLATAVARSRLSQYPDGVWMVELANIDADDPDIAEAIAVEIATVLDLRLTGSAKPIEQLLDYLQHKQLLLLLDNFEHLLPDGVDLILELVQRCENVQTLVTSREALKIRAEWAIALTGLYYPVSDDDQRPSNAVNLFVARWAQRQHGAMASNDLPAVRAICRLVKGLPLAIELAAALTQQSSPQTIADELTDGFDALTAALRDMPEHHRGLHVVFEMSWRTLTPILQERLARLSVFRNGFTETAVQQIAEANTDHLVALCEKSLLIHDPDGQRYTLHPVIQAYAAKKLPAADLIAQKHADYYLDFLAAHAEPLQKNAPQEAVRVIEPDIDNVRLAWQTGIAHQKAIRLFAALKPLSIYYRLRGLAYEGESVMQATRNASAAWSATPGKDDVALTIRAGLERARFQNRLGQYHPAVQTIKATLKAAAQHTDQWAEGMGHVLWGEALWRQGEYDSAAKKLLHALNIAQAIEDTLILGWCHHHLGVINDIQGHYDAADDHLQKACSAWQKIENAHALSGSLNSIGLVRYNQGNLPAAHKAMEEALTLCNQLGNRYMQSALLNNLSFISMEQSDYTGAQYYLQLALELAIANNNLAGQGDIYTNLGKNHLLMGEVDAAAESLEKGLHIATLLGNSALIAIATIILAEVKKEKADLKQAESLYRQALKIARQNQIRRTECEALIGLAQLLSETDEKQAKQSGEEAVALANAIQSSDLLKRAEALVVG